MIYKTQKEIELIAESAGIIAQTLAELASMIKPGVTTLAIDQRANEFIRSKGGVPSFLNYEGFPFHLCASVNEVVAHGFPDQRPLKDGDVLSLDLGVCKNGYHGDLAYTFLIGNVSTRVLELTRVTKQALFKAIEQCVQGRRMGDIGHAIQSHAGEYGFGVVRDLAGHGIGASLHEKPEVPNFGRRGNGMLLKENLVLSIEPMINLGSAQVTSDEDGQVIFTEDGLPSVHFEQNVCVKKDKPLMLSDYAIIEEAEKKNAELNTSY